MQVAIMQPYFLPYLGYWQLFLKGDLWVFFDVVQYNKRSWMNRNRILHPDPKQEFQYISVPIKKHSQGTLIRDVVINENENWQQKIIGQLSVYKRLHAPFYDQTIEVVDKIVDYKSASFVELCIHSMQSIASFLDVPFNYKIASELDFDQSQVEGPGDWALEISKTLNADIYINPFSGYEIFDEAKYKNFGIELQFLKAQLKPYRQSRRENFTAGLSIIDVLMFNGPEKTKEILLNDFNIYSKKELIKHLENEKH